MNIETLRDGLFSWHGGQWSGVYSVASTLESNPTQYGNAQNLRRAVRELERLMQDAKHPEAVTPEDIVECNGLAAELRFRFGGVMTS